MLKMLRLEFFKIRRKKIWLMMILFLMVEMFSAFISASQSIANNPEDARWESIIYLVSSMNGLFMPILTAIVVSRICDMEHKGDTWKMLVATNVKRGKLFSAKYICSNILLLVVLIVQTVFMVLYGNLNNFSGSFPFHLLIPFLGGALITTLVVTAIQQWISLAIKNQAFALCLGMIGAFIGMTAAMFPSSIRHLFIWAYYLDLSPVSYSYTESLGMVYVPESLNVPLIIAALVMLAVFYHLGRIQLNRQEI
ncbi:ABC transporter permease [Virgibacillus sp. NKC19-3]|uniref:ABC transporter permease n=1 Tax=Virgibacillus saliphilus TaxID=2831674 RepID=UPI001C9AEDEE|nr:ABC transporter permease [Virgibacillus sp. NKC19-3]MBY7142614.1 ABC transporter permease [Virgibacillus sp. NKC19-3]